MNHIQTLQKAGIDTTYIQSIEDNSDRLFTRMFITFKNGLHHGTYASINQTGLG